MLVEPSGLPPEGKKLVADWLCKVASSGVVFSLVVILTSPWHIPATAQAQPLSLRKDAEVQRRWRQHSAEVLLYHGAERPWGAGPSSGKSTFIQQLCEVYETDMVQCLLHEGFQPKSFLSAASDKMRNSIFAGRQVAFHIDLNAYSDFHLANTFLRNLLLCQVLYDASTGQMVPFPLQTTLHIEIGALAGKRDLHSLKSYATVELLQSKFPEVPAHRLSLKMMYPILDILGEDSTNQVNNAQLQIGEKRFQEMLPEMEEVHHGMRCQICAQSPIHGACFHCVDCEPQVTQVFLCGTCSTAHPPTHEMRRWRAAERPALALRLMHAFFQPHPLDGPDRKLLDIRPNDLKTLQTMAGLVAAEDWRPDLNQLCQDSLPRDQDFSEEMDGFQVDVRRFPDPPNTEGTLQGFANYFDLLEGHEPSKARDDMILRRFSILAAFMARSQLFMSSDMPSVRRIGSLLVECLGVGLKQMSRGEEPCIHFVPTYTGHFSDDYQFFVPSLALDADFTGMSVCPRGAACPCNEVRLQLLELLPDKVLMADPWMADTALESALEDERQGIQALSCAFGIEARRVQEILEKEGCPVCNKRSHRSFETLIIV